MERNKTNMKPFLSNLTKIFITLFKKKENFNPTEFERFAGDKNGY